MPQPSDWVPLRWPSGPAAVAALKTATQADIDTLLACHKPETLWSVLNSPVNCLVVTWAHGASKDAEQQATLKPLIAEAKKQGLSVVGAITGDHANAQHAAKAAGLDGVLTDKPAASNVAGLVVIPSAANGDVSNSAPITALSDTRWPRIPPRRGGGTGAGPTGLPWVDANGWAVQLAQAKAPGKIIWVAADPPEGLALTAGAYIVAVSDAEAYGARWIVSLHGDLRRGLLNADSNSLQTWKSIAGALEFFARNEAWRNQVGIARLGVISDFAADNRFTAEEVLNLAARRPLPYRVIDRLAFSPQSLAGLKTAIWIDAQPPEAGPRKALMSFVQQGGLVFAAASASPITHGMKAAGSHEGRYNLFASGTGRIAIAAKPWDDPYLLAADAHLLMSRKYDVIRAWNGGSSNFNYTASPDRKSAVVHIVNYTGRPSGGDMSLYVAHPYKTARMHRADSSAPNALRVTPRAQGVEVYLPPFAAYAAVEYGVSI
jgi:hypothetical protein